MKLRWHECVITKMSDQFKEEVEKYSNEVLEDTGQTMVIILPKYNAVEILETIVDELKSLPEEKFIQ